MLLGAAPIIAAAGPPDAGIPSVTLPPDLARVLTDYEKAWRAGDGAALAALFAPDGFVLPNGASAVRGRDSIRQYYKGPGGPLALRALAFATQGGVGYIIGGFARYPGQPDVGKFILTLRRSAEGQWLIVSDMDNGNGQPPAPVSYLVGARPRSIAVADLDGDGRPDVAVANSGDGTVSLLLGVGAGRLREPAIRVPAGGEPSDIDAIDLDNDRDVDLVLANHETSHITVLLNDGKAGFTTAPGSPFETGARPHVHGLATGDFDGDGWSDVAVDSADTREVRLLRGGPDGLRAAVAIAVGTMPYFRLGAADVTGDGHPDILVPGQTDDSVRAIHRARGGDAMLIAEDLRLPLADKPWMVVGDDLDGDHRVDLVVVHSNAVSIWLAKDGGFTRAPGSPFAIAGATEAATGDLDGDGRADVAVGPWEGAEVTILAGARLTPRKAAVCERPVGLAIADLDGDGRGELLATCTTGNSLMVITSPGRP